MEFVASYLLLKENNQEVNKPNIVRLLGAINATIDQEALNSFLSKIEGKSFEEVMAAGSALMVSQRAAAPSSSAAPAASKAPAAKVEESEESDDSDDVVDFF